MQKSGMTRPGRHLAIRCIGGKARNELIVGRLQLRQERARFTKIKFEPFVERGVETVGLLKGLRERPVERFCLVQERLQGGQRPLGSRCIVTANVGSPNETKG